MRETVAIDITDALQARLDALPDKLHSPTPVRWTPEQDDALRAYWNRKRHADIAKALGHCENACRRRYEELTHD